MRRERYVVIADRGGVAEDPQEEMASLTYVCHGIKQAYSYGRQMSEMKQAGRGYREVLRIMRSRNSVVVKERGSERNFIIIRAKSHV